MTSITGLSRADVRVRRALAHLYDAKLISKVVDLDLELPTSCPYLRGSASCDAAVTPPSFSPGDARALLTDAGVTPEQPLKFSLLIPGTSQRLAKLVPLLQEQVPTGYPDSEPEWASGGGMLARMSFASELGAGNVRGLDVPWAETFPPDGNLSELVTRFGASLLGLAPDSRTLSVVREEMAKLPEPSQRRAAVALVSVSRVENVLEAMMNSVDAGSRPSSFAVRSAGSTLETNRAEMPAST